MANQQPEWFFYQGQQLPVIGQVFYVSAIQHNVPDIGSGERVTAVRLKPYPPGTSDIGGSIPISMLELEATRATTDA